MSAQTKTPEWYVASAHKHAWPTRVPRTRDYHKEATESVLQGTLVERHPLFVEPKTDSTPSSPFNDKKSSKEKVCPDQCAVLNCFVRRYLTHLLPRTLISSPLPPLILCLVNTKYVVCPLESSRTKNLKLTTTLIGDSRRLTCWPSTQPTRPFLCHPLYKESSLSVRL